MAQIVGHNFNGALETKAIMFVSKSRRLIIQLINILRYNLYTKVQCCTFKQVVCLKSAKNALIVVAQLHLAI